MTNRKLSLNRETLTALASDDLGAVVGASGANSCGGTCIEPRCFIEIGPTLLNSCIQSLCPCPTD